MYYIGFAGTRKHFTKVSNEEDDDTRHDEQKDRVESLTPDRETVLTSDSGKLFKQNL